MKLITILLFFPILSSAQAKTAHSTTLGVHFNLHDFKSGKPFGNNDKMDAGVGITLIKGINNHFDWMASLNGTFTDSAGRLQKPKDKKELYVELAALLRARFSPVTSRLQPYVTSGIGISASGGYYGIFIPLAAGIEFNIFGDAFILLNAQYRVAVTNNFNNHFFYSVGFSGAIDKKPPKRIVKNVAAEVYHAPPAPPDRDNDGFVDSIDVCPDNPGIARFSGCPDKEKDGIMDKDDNCPDVPGLLKYQGCPIPDTDQDGINDEQDLCIHVPGPLSNHGWPEIRDEIKNRINLAAKNIFFITGSYQLSPASFKALNEVVRILKEDINLKLDIEGHTDDVGTNEKNLLLSRQRARAVKDYLQNSGIVIDRLKSDGYGEERPVADNNTASGRAENRRVVMRLYY